MVKLKILGLGTGRCGTGSLATYLNNNGIVCGHESVYGCPNNAYPSHEFAMRKSGKYQAEVSWLALPFLEKGILSADKYIFLLRNPDLIIESYIKLNFFHSKNLNSSYVNFAIKNNKDIKSLKDDMQLNTIRHVNGWIERIEQNIQNKKHIVFKTDDRDIQKLNKFLNINGEKYPLKNKKTKQKNNLVFYYKDFNEYKKTHEIKKKYGYI